MTLEAVTYLCLSVEDITHQQSVSVTVYFLQYITAPQDSRVMVVSCLFLLPHKKLETTGLCNLFPFPPYLAYISLGRGKYRGLVLWGCCMGWSQTGQTTSDPSWCCPVAHACPSEEPSICLPLQDCALCVHPSRAFRLAAKAWLKTCLQLTQHLNQQAR